MSGQPRECREAQARIDRQRQLFARTAEYFVGVLGADPGYTSVLFRNGPVHTERDGWVVTYGGPPGGWTLYELADWIPEDWRRPQSPATAEGRNCSLFMSLCRFAGTSAGRTADLAREAARLNGAFAFPLPEREVGHVVKSVEGYRAGWEPDWHRPAWIARQAARGKRSLDARRAERAVLAAQAASMRAEGVAVDEIARTVGRSRSTVYEWLAARRVWPRGADGGRRPRSPRPGERVRERGTDSGGIPAGPHTLLRNRTRSCKIVPRRTPL